MSRNRVIHGITATGKGAIVQHTQTGEWYLDYQEDGRVQVSVDLAAEMAANPRAKWFEGLFGGQEFDVKV